MTPEQLRELLDALDLNPNDHVVHAVLLAEVKDFDSGAVGVSISATDDVTWVAQLGVLTAATIITTRELEKTTGDSDGQD